MKTAVWATLDKSVHGEELELKGFLFQARDGSWILSSESDLKGCCVGSPHKRKSQVALEGNFETYGSGNMLTVRGIFHAAQDGLPSLSACQVQKGHFPFWTCGIAAVLCFLIVIKLKRLLLP